MSEETVLKILSLSIKVADKAGEIIRKVMKSGDLGVVDKVSCLTKIT